jgi:GTPase SAR1 family protein
MDFLDKNLDPSPAEMEVDNAKHIFMVGTLGAGKSTLSQALYYDSYASVVKDETFKSSKALTGVTQIFETRFSPYLRCQVTDSPGLGDLKIALPLWMKNFNKQALDQPKIDLAVVVIERQERVNTNVLLALTLLDITLK